MKPTYLSLIICGLLSYSTIASSKSIATHSNPELRMPLQQLVIRAPEQKNEQAIFLKQVAVHVNIVGSLAETTLELEVYNPNARQLEGELELPLQDQQTITGFALDLNGEMRDAVPVPKAKGRQVFEAIERRRVDPALLEQTQGNNFKLRIYPIPAKGTRKVKIIYQEALQNFGTFKRYELPISFANTVEKFTVNSKIQGYNSAPKSNLLSFKSDSDQTFNSQYSSNNIQNINKLNIDLTTTNTTKLYTSRWKNSDYFYAEIPVNNSKNTRTLANKIGILWDASLSAKDRDTKSELALLDEYFKRTLNAEVELTLLRNTAQQPIKFTVKDGNWNELKKYLESVIYDGASNLNAWKSNPQIQEYLLFSDGLSNFGSAQTPVLTAQQRLYSIYGNVEKVNQNYLKTLAEKNRGQLIHWNDVTSFKTAQDQLFEDRGRILSVDGNGIDEVYIPSYYPENGIVKIYGKYSANVAQDSTIQVKTLENNQEKIQRLNFKTATQNQLIAPLWASQKIAQLNENASLNQKQILALGNQFGLVSPATSLIVLDRVEDYLQYDIEPPQSLRKEYDALKQNQVQHTQDQEKDVLKNNIRDLEEHKVWWNTPWPKQKPQTKKEKRKQSDSDETANMAYVDVPPAPAPMAPPMMLEDLAGTSHAADAISNAAVARATQASTLSQARRTSSAEKKSKPQTSAQNIQIEIQPWKGNAPYVARLSNASKTEAYQIYLDERNENLNNPSFYLAVADLLQQKDLKDQAILVLSNLAELNLENRYILRLLAQQLMVYGQTQDAIIIYQKVLNLAEEEPQSWRDLALAYAENKQYDKAIQTIYHVVEKQWDGRFGGINLIAMDEMNNFIAKAPNSPAIKNIPDALKQNFPVGIRVVLTWDSDNSDMDLWVTDPNQEKTFYSHKQSYQGGIISKDFTGGYGPEVFWLKEPIRGEYKIQVHYFGDRQQIVTGPTTAFVRLIRNWGKANQTEEILRVKMTKERNQQDDGAILIGKFVVK